MSSVMFSRIKNGNWPEAALKIAVKRKWITAEEYKEITGKGYEA